MFIVPIITQPQVRIGKPQLLFEKTWMPGAWTVGPDDQRILTVRSDTPPTTDRLQIVMNWFNDLRQRAPAR